MAAILPDPRYGEETNGRPPAARPDTGLVKAAVLGPAVYGAVMPGRPAPRPRPSLAFRRLRALTILVVALALLLAVVHQLRGPEDAVPVAAPADASTTQAAPPTTPASEAPSTPDPTPTPSEAPASTQSQAAEPEPSPSEPAEAAAIEDAVEDWHDDESGHLAVAAVDLVSGRTASYGDAGHAFSTASIVKVDILATLLLQTDGELTGNQRAVASQMIRQSSNEAATTLWRQIGQKRGLETANEQLGLTGTRGGTQGTWGLTTTTTKDQLRLLQTVFTEDSPLTPEARTYVQTLMGGVATDQDWGVTAADSRGDTHAYVKNGWLPRTGGWIVNSVGKVEHDGHPVLIAVLSDGGATQQKGISAVERVAKQVAADVAGG